MEEIVGGPPSSKFQLKDVDSAGSNFVKKFSVTGNLRKKHVTLIMKQKKSKPYFESIFLSIEVDNKPNGAGTFHSAGRSKGR